MIFQLVKGTCLHQNIQKNLSGGWRSTTIVSTLLVKGSFDDSIQLANMMATVANEGYYYTPHIIKR
jgi:penicillin-binding protein 2